MEATLESLYQVSAHVDGLTPLHPRETTLAVERGVLGVLIERKEGMNLVADRLKPHHFAYGHHQNIYQACLSLYQAGDGVDVISLPERLEELSGNKNMFDVNELMLEHLLITTENLPYYAGKVIDHYLARQAERMAKDVLQISKQPTGGAHLLHQCSQRIQTLLNSNVPPEQLSTAQLSEQALEELLAFMRGQPIEKGLPTGLSEIDRMLNGFKPGELIILAARPGMGKSALALNMAAHAAIKMNQPTLFFSLEMGPIDLGKRIIQSIANRQDEAGLREAKDQLAQCPLEIIDKLTDCSVQMIKGPIARTMAEKGNVGLVVIDYLQLMAAKGENQNIRISSITRALKIAARQLNVPILCLSQLSRAVETRNDKKPMLSDLRDSGSIEQDADVVLFIHRDEYYNPSETTKPGIADILIAKHRNGPTGEVEVCFKPSLSRFSNKSKYTGITAF